MTTDAVRIVAEPQTNTSCRFVVDRPLYPKASFFFATKEQSQESALARRIFDLEGVTSVLLSHDQVTVGQGGFADWRDIGPRIGAAIRDYLASGEPAVSEQLRQSLPPAEVIRQRVQDVLDEEVNPAVGQHGGFVRLVDVRENAIFIQMGGGCQGCGMAKMTLRNGVETAIRRGVPEVGAIFDATDHASGESPYYASSNR